MPTPADAQAGPNGPNGPPDAAGSPEGGHRHLGHGRRLRSGDAPQGAPDLAVLARDAVISFLNDASQATADRAGAIPAQAPDPGSPETVPQEPVSAASQIVAPQGSGSAGWSAAAIGVATLDRIEAAAAKVEADIAVALRAYADLQAGAGAAAEAAVHAAQSAMASAGVATEAERQVRISLRQVRQYVVVTVVLLVVVIIVLAEITSPVR
jgi:hypothetical protein